ncbi:ATP-dependent DNA helicase, partial [Saccharata proteae CBS 121410]
QYPWSRDVKAALKDLFGLKGFRPHQAEAINATLAGKDCFVLMPTGGGKSLCYQLPSVIKSGKTRGVTIVISPLLSLMEDQVAHLRKLNIQAFYINGEIGADQRRQILNGLKDPKVEKFIQLLYVTPEMLSKNQIMINAFTDLHRRQRLSRIVIDEAHCVSQWGHDFRPDYKAIGQVRELFPGVPVMALTATATENVKVDVMHNLGIDDCEVFVQSFNRPNLHYEIRQKKKEPEVLDSIANTIKSSYNKQSGIVYCLSRKKCETLAKQLREGYGIRAHHYHAGMEPAEKSKVQKQWQSGVYHVIVATIAFGMGIDKPDVRFVIHHSIPKSLEGYYQETGRAGRDGKRSGCFLYYGYGDSMTLKNMITKDKEQTSSPEQQQRQLEMLRNVIMFCENKSDCRRVQVLAYFNEPFRAVDCNAACDNCNSTLTFENCDFTDYAKQAIKLVQQVEGYKVTQHQLIDIFRGKVSRKVKESGYDDLAEFGAGADMELCDVERLFHRLLSEDALAENNVATGRGFVTQYIKMGKHWQDIYNGRKRVVLNVQVSPGKSRKATKRQRTGVVAAARDEYPLSTNVSSPVQAASRRRKVKEPAVLSHDDGEYHNNGYRHNGFIVGDHESDEDSDGFEPVRTGTPRKRSTRAELGPPITIDQKMESLNDTHRDVVDQFVREGGLICGDIRTKYSLRERPFSDTILREMAIRFPRNEAEMRRIPGIRPEMVQEYGKKFFHLIETSREFYESMMSTEDSQRVPIDPNREVVEISDDDDDDDD